MGKINTGVGGGFESPEEQQRVEKLQGEAKEIATLTAHERHGLTYSECLKKARACPVSGRGTKPIPITVPYNPR